MTLSLYIARRFLRAFLLVALVFAAILFMIDMLEQIRRYDAGSVGVDGAALLAALNVPAGLYAILPLLMVLAGVVLFLGLARTSELVVIRAAGRSALRMLVSPVLVALALGLLALGVGNPIVAGTSQRVAALTERLDLGAAETMSVGVGGIWLRQGGPDRTQVVIRADRADRGAEALYGASFLIFGEDAGPIRRIEARSAQLAPGEWVLHDAKDWQLAPGTNPELTATLHDELRIPSDLTSERIRDGFGSPATIPIWDLPEFIAGLERAGFSARRHAVWLQMELAQPLLLAAMVLLAAGFTMRHARLGGSGMMVLLALAAGLAVFFLRDFAQVLGENGQIPVALAAWAPPVAALMLALGLLLHKEEG